MAKKKAGTSASDGAPEKKAAPKAPAKKKPASGGGGKKKSGPGGIGSWLLKEALTWGGGAALGTAVACGLAWREADAEVAAWLLDPPSDHPGLVYSAPLRVREGEAATAADLTDLLLSAGYERVGTVTADDQFSESAGAFEIRTSAMSGPGFEIPKKSITIAIADGRVTAVEPGSEIRLRPVVLATIGDPEDRRAHVDLAEMSAWVEKAICAMEDSRFRSHYGVDPIGVARAIVHDLGSDGDVHGGSTLTQQLAKNLFLTPERTARRKVREAFVAFSLERRLSKDEILQLYVDEVYLGQAGGRPIHGVENAARAWFGTSSRSLTLGEAATIAGVISSPNAYSPMKHPEEATVRRDLALDRLLDLGWASADEVAAAKSSPILVDGQLPGGSRRAGYAVDEAVRIAEISLGDGALATSGDRVYTTIDPLLQIDAERAITDGMAEVEEGYPKAAGAEAALVALRPDGSVVALVGGRDWIKSPFNRAWDAHREIGSTAKPLVLLAAFDADPKLTPLSRVWDSPIVRSVDGKRWTPQNYDGQYHGEVTVRQAIESSYNIPAIRLSETVGLEALQAELRQAGLADATNYPSVALGAFPATPLALAGAYTVFPGNGTASEPYLVAGIADADGNVLIVTQPTKTAVATSRAAALATSVLEGVITDGTGARAREYGVKGPVGGKTGTTNDYKDAWFAGFTPDLVTVVWVGRDKPEPIGLSGSRAALPSWARFVSASGPIQGDFTIPAGLVREPVCLESDKPARKACPQTYRELFPEGAVPSESCDLHGGPIVKIGRLFGGGHEEPEPAPEEVRVVRDEPVRP